MHTADAAALGVAVGTWWDIFPHLAAVLSVAWFAIQICAFFYDRLKYRDDRRCGDRRHYNVQTEHRRRATDRK